MKQNYTVCRKSLFMKSHLLSHILPHKILFFWFIVFFFITGITDIFQIINADTLEENIIRASCGHTLRVWCDVGCWCLWWVDRVPGCEGQESGASVTGICHPQILTLLYCGVWVLQLATSPSNIQHLALSPNI